MCEADSLQVVAHVKDVGMSPTSVAWSADSKAIVVAGVTESEMRVAQMTFCAETGKGLQQDVFVFPEEGDGHYHSARLISLSPHGHYAEVLCESSAFYFPANRDTRILDFATHSLVPSSELSRLVKGYTWHPCDGAAVVIATEYALSSDSATVVDLPSGRRLCTCSLGFEPTTAEGLRWAPPMGCLIWRIDRRPQTQVDWALATPDKAADAASISGRWAGRRIVLALACSADAAFIAVSMSAEQLGQGCLQTIVYAILTGQLCYESPVATPVIVYEWQRCPWDIIVGDAACAAFSPDSKWAAFWWPALVSAGQGLLFVSTRTWKEVAHVRAPRVVHAATWSPDGSRVAVEMRSPLSGPSTSAVQMVSFNQ